jgi:hypothetical protein
VYFGITGECGKDGKELHPKENVKLKSTRENVCWKTKRPFGLFVHQDGEVPSIHSASFQFHLQPDKIGKSNSKHISPTTPRIQLIAHS